MIPVSPNSLLFRLFYGEFCIEILELSLVEEARKRERERERECQSSQSVRNSDLYTARENSFWISRKCKVELRIYSAYA